MRDETVLQYIALYVVIVCTSIVVIVCIALWWIHSRPCYKCELLEAQIRVAAKKTRLQLLNELAQEFNLGVLTDSSASGINRNEETVAALCQLPSYDDIRRMEICTP